MLRTTDEMRRTGGRVGGRARKRTRAPSERGLRVDERTGGRTGAQAGGRADERTGLGTLDGQADEGGQWADGRTSRQGRAKARTGGRANRLADWRTSGRVDGGRRADDGFPKGKLPI